MKKQKQFLMVGIFALLSFNVSANYSDKVIVIINEDVITQSEFDFRKMTILADAQRENRPLPADIDKQLMDGMISDRLQIQEAKRRGIAVTDQELNGALERYAAQQNMTYAQMAATLESSGQSSSRFAETLRESLTISRLTDYYAQTRVVVPDYEITGWLAANNMSSEDSEYEVAHLLIKNPSQNSELAQQVRQEIRNGMSFQQAVLTYSEATDAQEGGLMGWRTSAQLPEVFVAGLKEVQVGGVTEVLETPNGLHILKLLNLKGDRTEIIQNRVRHILISSESKVAKSQAAKKLFEIRQRILDGEDFEQLARIYSDDSVSAATGGSLDWVSPGDMVKPFEEAFKQLAIDEISKPIETRFGMHILRVEDRRKKNVTEQLLRNKAASFLRRQRADREFNQWVRELREQAYIEYVGDKV